MPESPHPLPHRMSSHRRIHARGRRPSPPRPHGSTQARPACNALPSRRRTTSGRRGRVGLAPFAVKARRRNPLSRSEASRRPTARPCRGETLRGPLVVLTAVSVCVAVRTLHDVALSPLLLPLALLLVALCILTSLLPRGRSLRRFVLPHVTAWEHVRRGLRATRVSWRCNADRGSLSAPGMKRPVDGGDTS